MSLSLVAKPAIAPVTLDEARENMNVEHHDDDALISRLIAYATEYVERHTNMDLVQRTWDYSFDSFPSDNIILPKYPIVSVTSVTYTNVNESPNLQTVATTVYGLDAGGDNAILYLKYGQVWPSHTVVHNGITVRFISGHAGLGSPEDLRGNIDEGIRGVILMLVGDLYERRESSNEISITNNAIYSLALASYRRWKS